MRLAAAMAVLIVAGDGATGAQAQPDTSGPSLAQEMLAGPRPTYLPMPLYRPLIVPQQEAPGVVVSEPQTIEPEGEGPATPVALSVAPEAQNAAVGEEAAEAEQTPRAPGSPAADATPQTQELPAPQQGPEAGTDVRPQDAQDGDEAQAAEGAAGVDETA
ncbi:MAG: hypothetical protein AAFW98_02210, partial [Pseudomonadota bacterium]